ncbi:mitogen-activated protein kinase kinase kinase 1-like [Actinidia eriantha]|uniref:mitogen-activated protein kinase kinase kinase 1-like n=1 Tax=Actinidia eriantha TaxID=165200 RepID=UPI002588B720|nr:mitogen-activated protein kinase kinase kinase 1-like [Actinidia eriantha]XP_057504381.1 mitogen-activated protein kinase kinase kinase 1-like [Actinidia eriantha]
MHRIPRFFIPSDKRKIMDSKQKGRAPKLERRLAKKNIDYEPTPTSSSAESSSLRTRSLDSSPFANRTSFRIQGTDGEIDMIYEYLGISGPEDFGIPADAWEARKLRSSLDLPRSRLRCESGELNTCADDDCETLSDKFRNGAVGGGSGDDCEKLSGRLRGGGGENDGCEELSNRLDGSGVGGDCERLSDRLRESVRVSDFSDDRKDTRERVGFKIVAETSRGGGGGIKGVRPPVLAPPPSISLPVIDNTSSTWDILKSFAPVGDRGFSSLRGFASDDDDEEETEKVERVNGVRSESAVLSEACSFTTSNDDDSSSTTTEPTSNISPNDRFRRIITHWEKGELLGRGSFGSVYEGIADGGFFIAVKEVSLLDQGDQGRQSIHQLEQEIALLSQFEHENIVQYYGTAKDESNLYIFLELITKGSLLQLYQKYNLQDSTVSSYTRQILHGLKYLHERNVIHRDIKCANILVGANGSVKLADFGLAKVTKLNDIKSCKGTPFWMAPEVVRQNKKGYGLAADIWSLGCTVLEMLTRQLPYSHLENSMQALYRIGKGEPPPIPDSLSGEARDFILQCLQVNPNARPTASQLLDHSFVRRPLPTSSGSSSPYHSGRLSLKLSSALKCRR